MQRRLKAARGEPREEGLFPHGAQLPGRPGQEDDDFPLPLQHQAGGGPGVVGKDVGAAGHLGLPGDDRVRHAAPGGEVGLDLAEDGRIGVQGKAEEGGGGLPRHVVGGRSQAAGDQHQVGAGEGLGQRGLDVGPVRDGHLALHPDAQGEEFLGQPGQVGVHDVAQEQLRAGVEDFRFHSEGEGAWSPKGGGEAIP